MLVHPSISAIALSPYNSHGYLAFGLLPSLHVSCVCVAISLAASHVHTYISYYIGLSIYIPASTPTQKEDK